MPDLRLSIITINFNNADGLVKTMESVFSQSVSDFEYLVIDGGSSDGSKEIIENYHEKLAYWCSEKDNGIYHAMNKGIKKAQGEYVLFLNSGDCLHDCQVVENLLPCLHSEDIIYGDLLFQNQAGNGDVFIYPDVLTLDYFWERSLGHPASFIRRRLFQNSMYSEHLRIVSDWEFFLQKIVFQGASYKHIPRVISVFDTQGISSNAQELCEQERQQVLHAFFPGMVYDYVDSLISFRKLPLYAIFCQLGKTRKLQHRIKPFLNFILTMDRMLSSKKKKCR